MNVSKVYMMMGVSQEISYFLLPWCVSFTKRFGTGGRRLIDLEKDRHSSKAPYATTSAKFQLPHNMI